MYEATLQPISNREDWIGTVELIDNDTNEPVIDIAGYDMTLEVRDRFTRCVVLSATSDNGKVTTSSDSVIEWHFPLSDMQGVCAASYHVGITISRDGLTSQLLIGVLPVLDGVVSR